MKSISFPQILELIRVKRAPMELLQSVAKEGGFQTLCTHPKKEKPATSNSL